jgi:surface antigen
MKKISPCLLAVCLAAAHIGGCANMTQTEQGAAIGAAAGGVLGAVASKNRGQGALVGAALGAVAGGLIGNYLDKQNASRAEAARKYNYDQRVERLEIESATVAPQTVSPGGNVNASVQYTTLQQNEAQEVRLTETRTLVAGKETYDLGRREVVRAQGTHTSTAKLNLPQDLPRGSYTLVTTISDGRNTRTARSHFSVA